MAVDFQSPTMQRTYSDRAVGEHWRAWCEEHLSPRGKDVVDVGCGGGIYVRGFSALGARSVTGVDLSAQYVNEAREASRSLDNVQFLLGSTTDTTLPDECADLVFHRAVIHHLDNETQALGAHENRRILRPAGVCLVQDRTVEDVESTIADYWIRATLFETFPRLLDFERRRRPATQTYHSVMAAAGFRRIEVLPYPETRRVYATFADLQAEILARKGKSILFELSDSELKIYCAALAAKATSLPIVEMDSWTIWLGTK
jgi:ubiquinone/menaquinone biosynthesis C-methylase UbiE